MRKREVGDYIQDILEAIIEVKDFTKGMAFEDFVKDKKTIQSRRWTADGRMLLKGIRRKESDLSAIYKPKVPKETVILYSVKEMEKYPNVEHAKRSWIHSATSTGEDAILG